MLTISYKGFGDLSRGKSLWCIARLTLIWIVLLNRNAKIFEDR